MPCPCSGGVASGSGRVTRGAPMPATGNAGGCIDIAIVHALGNGNGGISPNGVGGGINGGKNIGGVGMTGTSTATGGECLAGTWVCPGGWSAAGVGGARLPCRPTVAAARSVHSLYSRLAAHLR